MSGRVGFEFEYYLLLLSDPDFADYTGEQFAKIVGVKKSLIYDWNTKIDWEAVNVALRKKYAKLMPKVDRALFNQTQKGDVPAIRTYYERFDGWTPASKVQTEQLVSEKELDEAIANELSKATAADVGKTPAAKDGAVAVLPAEPGTTEVHK